MYSLVYFIFSLIGSSVQFGLCEATAHRPPLLPACIATRKQHGVSLQSHPKNGTLGEQMCFLFFSLIGSSVQVQFSLSETTVHRRPPTTTVAAATAAAAEYIADKREHGDK